jgi:4-hydroxybenzoate polyprenyltransferase
MAVLQLIILALLITVGEIKQLGWFYYGGVMIAGGLSVYQQVMIFHRVKSQCFKAFLNNNWFGLTVFVGLVLEHWLG